MKKTAAALALAIIFLLSLIPIAVRATEVKAVQTNQSKLTCLGKRVTVLGTPQADAIVPAEWEADKYYKLHYSVVRARGGNDVIDDEDYDSLTDWICGNGGKDEIAGGYQADTITGGPGNDRISGGRFGFADGLPDRIYGGLGYDVCYVDPPDIVTGCEEIVRVEVGW